MLSGRGRGVLVGALFLMIVGTLLNNTELFAMAGALIALCILSYLVAIVCARRLTVEQDAPGLVAAGEPFDIRVTLGGTLLIGEMRFDVGLALPDGVELQQAEKLHEEGRRVVWACRAVAPARGVYQIGDMTVTVEDPVGLISLRRSATGPKELLVWPAPLDPREPLDVHAGSDPSGYHDTGKRAQDGSSIYGVRQWAPGDSSRRVHWPSTARLGKLAVLEFEADSATDLLVVLDVRRPASREAFETACRAASFLLNQSWASGHLARLAVGERVAGESPGRTGPLPRMEALAALAKAEPAEDPEGGGQLTRAIARLADEVRQTSTTVILTTLWDEDARSALEALERLRAAGAAIVARDGAGGNSSPDETFTLAKA